MATVNYSWTLPTVGASVNTWGTLVNTVLTDIDAKMVGLTATQTLTNKTLTAPVITGGASITGNLTLDSTNPAILLGTSAMQIYKLSTDMRFYNGSADRMTLDASGNLLVGALGGSSHVIKKASAEGNDVLEIGSSTTGSRSGLFCTVSAEGWAGSATALYIGKNASNGRSINSGGTVNSAGADYAEYESNNGIKFSKGQVVGFKDDGTLTDIYADAIRFGVKSTNPGLVGGDSWGHGDQIGRRPDEPVYIAPEYRGATDPGPEPVEPIAPDAPPEIPPSLPLDEGADDESRIQYAAAQMLIRAKVMQAAEQYKHAVEAHEVAHAKWLLDKAAWDAAAYTYRMEQRQHKGTAEVAKDLFDNTTMPEYRRALEAFEQRLEAERQLVDRIAYSGKVPVNVLGATPGQLIVAVPAADGGIMGQAVNEDDITLKQYLKAVGRVNRIFDAAASEHLAKAINSPNLGYFIGMAEVAVIIH